MKFFDRLIAFNTAIVGLAIVVALLFPSFDVPSIKLPEKPTVQIPKSAVADIDMPDVDMPEVEMPSVTFTTPQFNFKNPFSSGKPHIAGVFAEAAEDKESVVPTATPKPTATPTPTATPIPIADPVSIDIPSFNISAQIVKVGLTADNAMEIPADYATVGWYYPSGKPGEEGSAVLNGHYDNPAGLPAAFFNLKNLKNSDEIVITAADKKKYVFAVQDVFSHPLEAFPHDLLYEDLEGQHIKLLTCDGIWNAQSKNYSNRLVVAALLKEIR